MTDNLLQKKKKNRSRTTGGRLWPCQVPGRVRRKGIYVRERKERERKRKEREREGGTSKSRMITPVTGRGRRASLTAST